MLRAFALATIFFVMPGGVFDQSLSVLHVKVVLVDAAQKAMPVPRHVLLVSDNPATTTPRRMVTALDGSATLGLRPGSYTVESDRALAFQGKTYQWTRTIEIVAGRDAFLELTAANAEIETLATSTPTATPASPAPPRADTSALLLQWHNSIVTIWTPTLHASGFVVDAKGLIATSQRAVGSMTSVEVQLTPAMKVTGNVLVADPVRDVAILQIDLKVLASVRPVPMGCATAKTPPLVEGQEIFTIGAPLRAQKGLSSGNVSRVEPGLVVSDFVLAPGSNGGPVFTADGVVVGLTSIVDEKDQKDGRWRGDSRVVGVADACDLVASAELKMMEVAPPDGTPLPVEPVRPYPLDALKDAAQRRAGNISPQQMSSSDFDIAMITPLAIYGAQHQTVPLAVRPLMDFSNWASYVVDVPPVLLVRVTPKLVESFWTTVARGAAMTQGVSLPPIKRFKSGFLRMQAFCGDAEVTPIHPFKVERRVSETEAIYEGLYVFDPDAFGPQCKTAKLVLYSEKEPGKGDMRALDLKVLQQIWQDFASYREQKQER